MIRQRPASYPTGPEPVPVPTKRYVSDPAKLAHQVKPFTKESLERLERKTIQLVREYGFQPKRKLSVEDGSRLPSKFEPFPKKLYAIYTLEMLIKTIAKGFILNKYTYLRNPWNWLDFVVITSGYATIGVEGANLAGLRTFRVLRALKTISILPGLKTIINALLHSFKQLAEVMTLTIFCLMVFALFALQVYKGELRNKCVSKMPDTNDDWYNWTRDPDNWLRHDATDDPILCGNVTGSRHCPHTHTCLCVGENPNHGYTSFDNFLWSMLTTFQLITLDYWENVYNMVLASCGPISVSFFTVVVFFGSFYLINLMLAERKKELVDHREDSTFSFDPTNLNVKRLSRHKMKKIDARKGVLLSSYTRKKTRRRKRTKSKTEAPSSNVSDKDFPTPSPNKTARSVTPSRSPSPKPAAQKQHTLHPNKMTVGPSKSAMQSRQASSNSGEGKQSSLDDSGVVDDHEEGDATSEDAGRLEVTPATTRRVKVIRCNGVGTDKKKPPEMYTDYLSHIVVIDSELPDRNCSCCERCCTDYEGWLQFQQGLYRIVKDPLFELAITICIVLNTMFLAMEHHGMSESVLRALDVGNKGPGICLAVFLPTLVMGNFMVLNLFLALLLNSFNSEELKHRKEEVGDESKLAQSFQRIRDLVRNRRLQEQETNSRLEQIVREVMQRHAEEKEAKKFPRDKRSYQEAMNRPISIISYDIPEYQLDKDKRYALLLKEPEAPPPKYHENATNLQPWQTLVSYVDELTLGRDSKGLGVGNFPGFGNQKPPKVPSNCFPKQFYERCACLDKCASSEYGLKWTKFRTRVLDIVDTSSFEWFILVLIFASSVTLCFEDIHLDENPQTENAALLDQFYFFDYFRCRDAVQMGGLGILQVLQ
ncbi:unnamed protein product [Ceutorhynchus assimilis]|uniref:Ion transport domain-containing protein n=1 Tax=Ceutorhynchus assimilis TaxID=467358 RepID=A0A9N9QBU1_9CUCU|nr:unnamed protein product [Ceutorhynchus assimilis]